MLKKKKGQKGRKASPASSKTKKMNKKATGRKDPRTPKKTKVRKKTKVKKKKTELKKRTGVGKKKSSIKKKTSAVKKSPATKKRTGTRKVVAKKSPSATMAKPVKKESVAAKRHPVEERKPAVRRSNLSPAREEALRRMLLEKKAEVWKDVKQKLFVQMGKEYREEMEVTLDDADKAMADLAAETGISLLDMRTDVLSKIDRALAKLDEGTYGICEDCGANIHENRLKVVPFAIYCIDCKTKREEMESIAREPDRFASTGPEELE